MKQENLHKLVDNSAQIHMRFTFHYTFTCIKPIVERFISKPILCLSHDIKLNSSCSPRYYAYNFYEETSILKRYRGSEIKCDCMRERVT